MSGVVLAVPDCPGFAPQVLEAAACLAELTRSSRISVLVIRTPPDSTILPSEEILSPQDEVRIRGEEAQRSDELKRRYEEWSHSLSSDVRTEWIDIEGMADRLVNEWGRRADFIVLKRPVAYQTDQERRAIHATLFDSGRPVLLVPPIPQPASFGRRIAICWRDDERSARAVLSGLRCAAGAEEIHVLAGTREQSKPPRFPEILEEHGIAAKLHVLPIKSEQAFSEMLLHAAHQLGADMLVMGAFVHNPVRNLILGGVTRYMLIHADLPVLMRH